MCTFLQFKCSVFSIIQCKALYIKFIGLMSDKCWLDAMETDMRCRFMYNQHYAQN